MGGLFTFVPDFYVEALTQICQDLRHLILCNQEESRKSTRTFWRGGGSYFLSTAGLNGAFESRDVSDIIRTNLSKKFKFVSIIFLGEEPPNDLKLFQPGGTLLPKNLARGTKQVLLLCKKLLTISSANKGRGGRAKAEKRKFV